MRNELDRYFKKLGLDRRMHYFKGLLLIAFLFADISCTTIENQSNVTSSDIANGKTASLTLTRQKNTWVGVADNVNVYINEKPMGHVSNGEIKTFYFIPVIDDSINVRFESADIAWVGLAEKVEKDSTITNRFRKEYKIKAKPKDNFDFFCSLETKELFIRKAAK